MIYNEEFITQVLEDCTMALVCPQGSFYPNKNFGSLIAERGKRIDNKELLSYARQAVDDLDGVYVKNAFANEENAVFTVMINDEERQVSISL